MSTLLQSLKPSQQVQRPYMSLGVPFNYSMPTTAYGSNLTGPALYQSSNPTLHTISSDKGKAKAQDADAGFEAAFAQAAASLRITDTNSSARIVELGTSSTAVEPVSEDVKAGTEFSELVSNFIACMCLAVASHFVRVWQRLQESSTPLKDEDLAKWESEFNQLMTAQREELEQDYGGAMQNEWESGIGEFTDNVNPKFDELGYPILAEYVFGEAHFAFIRAYSC